MSIESVVQVREDISAKILKSFDADISECYSVKMHSDVLSSSILQLRNNVLDSTTKLIGINKGYGLFHLNAILSDFLLFFNIVHGADPNGLL